MRIASSGLAAILGLVGTLLQPATAQADFSSSKLKVYNPDPYARSIILVSGKYHTLVPKGSLLNLPDRHKARITDKPSGDFLMLSKFITKNYGWLQTQEVTFEQSRGVKPIPKATMESIQNSGRVTIATLKKNPISVIQPKSNP